MWSNDYIGLPFELAGHSRQGLDCWGLVCLVYEDLKGITLPRHTAGSELDDEWMDRAKACREEMILRWDPTATPQPMDVYLFNVLGNDCHVGLHVNDRYFLHAFNGHQSGLQQWTGAWKNKVQGCYKLATS